MRILKIIKSSITVILILLFLTGCGKNNDQSGDTNGQSSKKSSSNEPINPNWKIAFVSRRDGNHEVYTMNVNCTGLKNLSNNKNSDSFFVWSPDGKKIAFESHKGLISEIYIVNIDGSGLKKITNLKGQSSQPTWSPDGKKIVFVTNRGRGYGRYDLFVISLDNYYINDLTDNNSKKSNPSWSPFEDIIAFESIQNGNKDIYLIRSDRTEMKRLTSNKAKDKFSAWSPDGRKILFETNRDGNWEIYAANLDGSCIKNLTNNKSQDITPAWSPDGNKIAFVSNRESEANDYGLFIMDKDGTNVKNLTTSSGKYPSWSNDGNWILFYSEKDGNSDIYVIDVEGDRMKRLTENKAVDILPSWQPKKNLKNIKNLLFKTLREDFDTFLKAYCSHDFTKLKRYSIKSFYNELPVEYLKSIDLSLIDYKIMDIKELKNYWIPNAVEIRYKITYSINGKKETNEKAHLIFICKFGIWKVVGKH